MYTRLLFKYLCLIFLINILSASIFSTEAFGQSRKSKKKEQTPWTDKLWYGGGVNLNFGSDAYRSVFTFGVSPMAGYKLNSFLSIGPRISLDWTIARFNDGFNVYKYNSLDYGGGIFARAKFLNYFFGHVEYSQLNVTYLDTNFEKFREWKDIFLLGLGYNSGEIFAYEFYISYNFLEDQNSFDVPIVYRGGITYRF